MKNTTTKTPPRFKSEAEEARWWTSKEGRAYSLWKFQQSAKNEKLRRGTTLAGGRIGLLTYHWLAICDSGACH